MIAWPRFLIRELRAGLGRLKLVVACLGLGVAAIAGSASLHQGFSQALDRDARALLGGDLDIRQSYGPPAPAQLAALRELGRITQGIEMRAMAQAGEQRRLVEVKAVDEFYPLAGHLRLDPPLPLDQALADQGAVADPALAQALNLSVGDLFTLGGTTLRLSALILHEPDRIATAFSLGPRLMISPASLEQSGLIQPGSLARWTVRVDLPQDLDPARARSRLSQLFPDAFWQIRDTSDAAPGLARILDNLSAFLTLAGLAALVTGGIGIAGAVKAHLEHRLHGIAVLKSLGAAQGQIIATHGSVIALTALAGTLAGLALAALVPWLVNHLAADSVPVPLETGPFPWALLRSGGLGLGIALLSSLWPLARAAQIPPSSLFRQPDLPLDGRLGWRWGMGLAALFLAVSALAIGNTPRPGLTALFIPLALACLALFRGLAAAMARLAARIQPRSFVPRLALAGLHRPGSTVVSMTLSLGLALSVMITLALVEGNLARDLDEQIPAQAPGFYVIDLQTDQLPAFAQDVAGLPGVRMEQAPMVRGRITRIGDAEAEISRIAPDAQWAVRGDRGLSLAGPPPAGTRLAAGTWWPPDYDGPPLLSLDANLAQGFGVTVGDQLTINVLGREINVTIANLRQIHWASLSMNFALILSPHALDGAPLAHLVTLYVPAGQEQALEQRIAHGFPNASVVRVKEALNDVSRLVAGADRAVRLAALATLAVGVLVLAGAVLAGQRRRIAESVLVKVLGATRSQLLAAFALEFALVGLLSGLTALAVACLASAAVMTWVLKLDWAFLPVPALAALAAATLTALGVGLAGAQAALSARPAAHLKRE